MKTPIFEKKSYCNPLSIPNCPMGDNYGHDALWYTEEPRLDFRSISDPSVLYYDNKWYLYPSYGMCFVSEDFATFKHVRTEPYNIGYSPSVIPHRDSFLLTAHSNGLFIGDSPTGPFEFVGDFIKPSGSTIRPIDSALFADDDGRIYIYWFEQTPPDARGNFVAMTMGVELDGDDPRKFLTDPVVIHKFNPDNLWERGGSDNQNENYGWIEGQWMVKHNGRYYMIYSAPGTQYRSYCMAAYYSDEGPLTGFKLQKNNPFCEHRRGVVSGAGHGCVQHGPDNTLWAFYTITSCATHPYERRIGMDRVWVNEDGELCCRVTDTPQIAYCDHQGIDSDSGLLPVNAMLRDRCRASSYENGRNAVYAIDESLITWWQPKEDDKEPYLMLRMDTDYTCEASRIIWRDVNMNVDAGILPGAFRYVIETRPNIGEGEWTTVLDMSENTDDLNVDYKTFPPTICREVRLRIVGSPQGITPGVAEFTLFGRSVRL